MAVAGSGGRGAPGEVRRALAADRLRIVHSYTQPVSARVSPPNTNVMSAE